MPSSSSSPSKLIATSTKASGRGSPIARAASKVLVKPLKPVVAISTDHSPESSCSPPEVKSQISQPKGTDSPIPRVVPEPHSKSVIEGGFDVVIVLT